MCDLPSDLFTVFKGVGRGGAEGHEVAQRDHGVFDGDVDPVEGEVSVFPATRVSGAYCDALTWVNGQN